MKEINLEKILFKKLQQLREKHPKENYYTDEMIRKSPEYEYFIGVMKDACQQVLELAAESAKIELREYEINGTYTSESLGQEIMIDEPNNYIGIDKQSILDVINQVK